MKTNFSFLSIWRCYLSVFFLLLGLGCSKDSGVTIGISPTHIDFSGNLNLNFIVSHSASSKTSVYFFSDTDCKTTHSQIGSSPLQNVTSGNEVASIWPGPWSPGSYTFYAKAVDAAGNSSSCTQLGSCTITSDLTRSCSLP